VLVDSVESRKKEGFFNGEVFFLLTCPLMDDPIFHFPLEVLIKKDIVCKDKNYKIQDLMLKR